MSLLCGELRDHHLHAGRQGKNAIPQVVHVEGDPDHPINRGTLCPKGSSLQQDILNDRRLLKPQVRRPGATEWEDISWDQAYTEIAQRVKKTRDDTFVETDAQGRTVNRCEGMAFTGGCTTLTSSIISPSKVCAAWGSATWKTRPAFDTAPRSPVWGPPSDAAQ